MGVGGGMGWMGMRSYRVAYIVGSIAAPYLDEETANDKPGEGE